jgi:hypothetical protein
MMLRRGKCTEEIRRIAAVIAAGTSQDAPQKINYNLGVPLRYYHIAAVLCRRNNLRVTPRRPILYDVAPRRTHRAATENVSVQRRS